MPLRIQEPPQSAHDTIRSTIEQFAERGMFGTPNLSDADPEQLGLALPHPIYTLTLEDLVREPSLRSARLVGWRYLVEHAGSPVAAAEVGVDGTFNQFNEGPFVRATIEAVQLAEQHPAARDSSYLVRLIRVPPLYVMALWLNDERGGDDLIVPMPPTPQYLEANRPYTGDEFASLLAEDAKRRHGNAPDQRRIPVG